MRDDDGHWGDGWGGAPFPWDGTGRLTSPPATNAPVPATATQSDRTPVHRPDAPLAVFSIVPEPVPERPVSQPLDVGLRSLVAGLRAVLGKP